MSSLRNAQSNKLVWRKPFFGGNLTPDSKSVGHIAAPWSRG
jgi:hypothetical protein